MHAGVAQACPLHGTAADASSDAAGDALQWTIEQNKQLLLSLKAENRELKQVRLQLCAVVCQLHSTRQTQPISEYAASLE